MKGAEVLIKALEKQGVDTVFGYPGGAIMPVYDALIGSKLKHVLVRHEQAAALAADGYARASGKVGVCFATSGPGATNLVTGIANAFLDSVPMVAVTGQVPTAMMGTDAFQEVDIYGITMPVVKHSYIVRNASELPAIVAEAFTVAQSGRPGPVLIDLPKDMTTCEVELESDSDGEGSFPTAEFEEQDKASEKTLERARQMMRASRKPLIYAGGGIRIANVMREFQEFVETTGIPVVTTLQGLGAIPASHPQFLGMLGMHGTKTANYAVQECDLLIAIGARFDDRVTGKLREFAPHAAVIHMDIDAAEIGKLRTVQCPIAGDIKHALSNLLVTPAVIDEWKEHCQQSKETYAWKYDAPGEGIFAPAFLKELSDRADANTYVSCDVGQHQMWVAQHFGFNRPHQHLTSGGLGTMGFGIPAAVGAQFAFPDSRVVCVTGDGSIMMNIQELATIKRYNLPVKIVLFDNKVLGMVRQWQELFFAERYSEVDLSDNPNFCGLAQACGIPAMYIDKREQVSAAVDAVLNTEGPLFVHAQIDSKENVWPLVPPGKSNSQMMEATA